MASAQGAVGAAGIGPLVVMGVSGSGKSVVGEGLASALGIPFIEGDRLHPQANVDKMSAGTPLTDEDRWPWLERVGHALEVAVGDHGGAIAACSALKASYRDRLRGEVGGGLRFIFLEGSRDLLMRRMQARKHHFMPASLLDSQMATLEPPRDEPGVLTLDVSATPEELIGRALDWLQAGPVDQSSR